MTGKATKNFAGINSILGVDPKTNKFTLWRFSADGGLFTGTSELVSGNTRLNNWNGKGPEGSGEGKGRLTKVDANTIKFEVLERKVSGKVESLPEVTIWKRQRR